MRVGILETGRPPGGLDRRFGDYPAMFARLLGGDFDIVRYDVAGGQLPERADSHPAYLITGSPAGVYDPLPWIAPLKHFLLTAAGKAKLVGICFGHQLMAEAFGGRVTQCERGWGVGLQTYEVWRRAPWMDEAASVTVPVSHQDQILEQPPHSTVLAGSDFTPFGMLAYDRHPSISMQFHPEFERDYASALIEFRRDRLPDPDAALASFERPNDRARVGEWIRRFLTS